MNKLYYSLAISASILAAGAIGAWAAREFTPTIQEKIVEVPVVIEKQVVEEVVREVEVPVRVEVPIVKEVVKTRIVHMPVQNPDKVVPDKAEQYCLALNIYREAGNQSVAGMIAVARVVLNRVNDRRFPETVCEVVYQGPVYESWKTRGKAVPDSEREYHPVKHKCQFSWYCDGRADEPVNPRDNIKWQLANDIAYNILAYNEWNGMIEGATHYHADYVTPSWSRKLQLIAKIDDHIFYRWQ